MASIRKRGNSYTVTVSCGYDSKGKKIMETATFTPDPKWSEERARKAADKFAVRFEDKIKALLKNLQTPFSQTWKHPEPLRNPLWQITVRDLMTALSRSLDR